MPVAFVPMFMAVIVTFVIMLVHMGVIVRMLRFCVLSRGIFEGISRTQRVCLPGRGRAEETAWAARGLMGAVWLRDSLRFNGKRDCGQGQTGLRKTRRAGPCGGHVTDQRGTVVSRRYFVTNP